MKKFFFKSLLLLIPVIAVSILFIFFFAPGKSIKKSLVYAQIDKNKLLETTPGPRIIFIGGSNLSFGLDSKRIKDSLNLNPVNTAIHISIGLKYMLASAERFIKENDIVVVSPEYHQFYGELANGKIELLSIVADVDPSSIQLLDIPQYFSLIPYIPKYIQSKLIDRMNNEVEDSTIGIYDRKSFNAFGDAYIHWTLPKQKVWAEKKIDGKFNNEALLILNKFRNIVEGKNARLFLSFPCYQDLSYKNSTEQIKSIEDELRKNKFILLSEPERYVFPDSLMYNSPYHLTKEGVEIRTTFIIEDLKKVLKR
jgi:hypothetical protein